jgi:16S rRNA (uracil1498-N3)-methyltransferase
VLNAEVNAERRTKNRSEYNANRIDAVTRPRFYAPGLDPSHGEVTLSSDESHHLARVMRLSAGDEIAVFDGDGHEYAARIVRADRNAATVVLGDPVVTPPEPAVPTTLVQAVLKGDKMDGVVRDATMAGAARIVPVVTDRSLVSLGALGRSHAQERWQRVAVASAKQCRRARLPAIEAPQAFLLWLDAPFEGLRLLLVEPSADAPAVVPLRRALAGPPPSTVACIVGPEGGWSANERDAAVKGGCVLASLGQMTLRADAVGLVAVSLVHFAVEERR